MDIEYIIDSQKPKDTNLSFNQSRVIGIFAVIDYNHNRPTKYVRSNLHCKYPITVN